jgi:outer membrane lipase/esterase
VLLTNSAALQNLSEQASALSVTLKNAGARYILVPNTDNFFSSDAVYLATQGAARPDLGLAYGVAIAAYGQNVWNILATKNVSFIPADFSSLFNYVVTHPTPFGFTSVSQKDPACVGVTAENCTPANWAAPNADKTHVFAESTAMHYTSGYQQIETDYVYNLLAAPGQISLLPLAQLRSRLGAIEAVRAQMPDTARAEGERHAWMSGDVAALKSGELLDAQPGKDLRPVSVAAGVDYQTSPQWLVGVGASFARANQSFATGGGFYSDDVAASLYLGFRQEGFWGNVIATAGMIDASTKRSAILGVTLENNTASPKGSGQSLAMQSGYDFATGLDRLVVTHGPVVGLMAQRARLDGFTETNGQSGLTALQFASQSRGSTIGELGYQARVDLGAWRLFSKLVWSHEMEGGAGSISTSLTTIAAPAYVMPAAALPRNWMTATAGAKYAISDKLSGDAAASLRGGSGGSGGFGVSLGLNLAF